MRLMSLRFQKRHDSRWLKSLAVFLSKPPALKRRKGGLTVVLRCNASYQYIDGCFFELFNRRRVKSWEFEIVGRQEIQHHMQVKRSFSLKLVNRHADKGSGQLMGKEFFSYCRPFQRIGASLPIVRSCY